MISGDDDNATNKMDMILLPYSNVNKCASCFDNTTLMQQYSISGRLLESPDGYGKLLVSFYNSCLLEVMSRCLGTGKFAMMEHGKICYVDYDPSKSLRFRVMNNDTKQPWFMGWDLFHKSHQAHLVRYKRDHYSHIFYDLEEYFIGRGIIYPEHHDPSDVLYIDPIEYDSYRTGPYPLFEQAPIASQNISSLPTATNQTVPELRQLAKERGYKNVSKMRKNELLTLLGIS